MPGFSVITKVKSSYSSTESKKRSEYKQVLSGVLANTASAIWSGFSGGTIENPDIEPVKIRSSLLKSQDLGNFESLLNSVYIIINYKEIKPTWQ